jgi:hypothetical protein
VTDSDLDKLADEVLRAYAEFDIRLHSRDCFPSELFTAFVDIVMLYMQATKDAKMIHRSVAGTVSGLREILELKGSRSTGEAIFMADRLECMLFSGYDPSFAGDEPSEL